MSGIRVNLYFNLSSRSSQTQQCPSVCAKRLSNTESCQCSTPFRFAACNRLHSKVLCAPLASTFLSSRSGHDLTHATNRRNRWNPISRLAATDTARMVTNSQKKLHGRAIGALRSRIFRGLCLAPLISPTREKVISLWESRETAARGARGGWTALSLPFAPHPSPGLIPTRPVATANIISENRRPRKSSCSGDARKGERQTTRCTIKASTSGHRTRGNSRTRGWGIEV